MIYYGYSFITVRVTEKRGTFPAPKCCGPLCFAAFANVDLLSYKNFMAPRPDAQGAPTLVLLTLPYQSFVAAYDTTHCLSCTSVQVFRVSVSLFHGYFLYRSRAKVIQTSAKGL